MRIPSVRRRHNLNDSLKPEVGESPAETFYQVTAVGEIQEEEETHQRENANPEKIYVAVGKDMMESQYAVRWALQNVADTRLTTVILLHVRVSVRYIPSPMGRLSVSQVSKEMVAEYKKNEQKEIDKWMKKHLEICSRFKVKAEPLVVEKAEVSKGIVEAIKDHKIGKLIIGTTSAGGSISRRIRRPGKADYVQKHALETCKVWIVCKGKLVRESGGSPVSPSRSVPKPNSFRSPALSQEVNVGYDSEELTIEGTYSESDEADSTNFDSNTESNAHGNSSSIHNQEGSEDVNTEIESLKLQLREALQDAEERKREMQMEAEERKKAEAAASKAINKFKACETQLRTMGEALRSLETKVRNEKIEELEAAHTKIAALEAENCRILQEKDAAMKELNVYLESRAGIDTATSSSANIQFTEHSYDDIVAATCDFADRLKIGEGGYGKVYRGEINETTMAIKILKEDSLPCRRAFQREIDILKNLRHPHLVSIVGACFERGCIFYEYMSNGSLRDRLSCKNATPPLPWHARFRIAAEVCSALQFLHTSKPKPIVHRDLKPENILLDENLVSKISDFGLARPIREDSSTESEPKGTYAYMDPEYFKSRKFIPKFDVYSLGVVMLQLLTGEPALGLVDLVEAARNLGELKKYLDPSAGEWPLEEATKLADLALDCTQENKNNRPDLHPTVMNTLDSLRTFAAEASNPSPLSGETGEDTPLPTYFIGRLLPTVLHTKWRA